MLFGNSVTYNKCDYNIYILFTKLDNISNNWIDMKMLSQKNMVFKKNIYCLIF